MTKIAFFPGQGSQFIGMGQDLYKNFSSAKEVFQEVDDAIGKNLSEIIFAGSIEDLTLTYNTQPALMATSMAVVRVLEKEFNVKLSDRFGVLAGHSLGEYTALCAAKVFSLSDTAKLLRIRGTSMQEAVPAGKGAMVAILNLSYEKTNEVCQKSASETKRFCTIANDNADGQIVISGEKEAVDRACVLAKEAGAKRALLLPVSAPFHCELMRPAAEKMAEALSNVKMNEAQIPVIANVLVEPITSPEKIKNALIEQVTGRVRWRETMDYVSNNNISEAIEIGAGKVLTNLIKRAYPNVQSSSMLAIEEIEAFTKGTVVA